MKIRIKHETGARIGRRSDSLYQLQGKTLKIGLLGGSFNPAHQGHIHLSRLALRDLGLDAVWWLVTPQNPLKSADSSVGLAARQGAAQTLVQQVGLQNRIGVSIIEAEYRTQFTVDSLTRLRRDFPRLRLVWLMGADGLAEFHRWKQWRQIMAMVPIAVFGRSPYQHRPISNRTAQAFASARFKGARSGVALASRRPPAWVVLPSSLNPCSSTQLRRVAQTRAVFNNKF